MDSAVVHAFDNGMVHAQAWVQQVYGAFRAAAYADFFSR
jgi:hypothetical protein